MSKPPTIFQRFVNKINVVGLPGTERPTLLSKDNREGVPIISLMKPYTKEEILKIINLLAKNGNMEITLLPKILDNIANFSPAKDFWLEEALPIYATHGMSLNLVNGDFSENPDAISREYSSNIGATSLFWDRIAPGITKD